MTYELEGVTRTYRGRAGPTRALDGVSFRVARGERVGILGASGSGKSTLFRLLNGSAVPSGGTLRFGGRDVLGMRPAERRAMRTRVGMVFQLPQLIPSLTVRQNALAGRLGRFSALGALALRLMPPRVEIERADAALAAVGLGAKGDARADELSGGQQQRVAIARVLMQDPEVVLADEPFASLDPTLVETVAELLFGLAADGRTLLVALHDVALGLRFFPRIVGLRGGKVFFDEPASAVTRELLDALYRGEEQHPRGTASSAA